MDQGLEKHVDGLCPASERGHDARLLATAGGAQPKKKRWRESRSKYEMTMELKERGITLPKSSTKEDLSRMLKLADEMCAGSRDMGSVLNIGGPLAIAIANEEFWKSLGSWRYLGLLSQLCIAFKSVQCNEAAWKTVLKCQAGGLLRKKSILYVLALPKSKLQQVSGRERLVTHWYGEPTKLQMTEFYGTSALEAALRVHGTMENIAMARIKKMESKEKGAAAKLRKSLKSDLKSVTVAANHISSVLEGGAPQGTVFPPIVGFEAHFPAPNVPHTGHVAQVVEHHATGIEGQNVFP